VRARPELHYAAINSGAEIHVECHKGVRPFCDIPIEDWSEALRDMSDVTKGSDPFVTFPLKTRLRHCGICRMSQKGLTPL